MSEGYVTVGSRRLRVLSDNPNSTHNLLYGDKVILNVPDSCIKSGDIPVLEMYDRIGERLTTLYDEKVEIVNIQNMQNVDIQFESTGIVQCGYSLESLKDAKQIYPLAKSVDLTEDEDGLSREYLLDNNRTFRIVHSKSTEKLYRLRFTDEIGGEVFIERNGYISKLHYNSSEVRRYWNDMTVKQYNDVSARLKSVDNLGIYCTIELANKGQKKDTVMKGVLLDDFLMGRITEDYLEKEYQYREELRWLNTTVKTKIGEGYIKYISPSGQYFVRIGGKNYSVRKSGIKFPKRAVIDVADLYFSKGGEPVTVIGGTDNCWKVQCGYSGKIYDSVANASIIDGSIGRQTYDLTGTTFINSIGEHCSIVDGKEISELSVKIDTDGFVANNVSLLSVMNGVVYTPNYTPDANGMYGSVYDIKFLDCDTSLSDVNHAIFSGVCKKCGRKLIRTKKGMLEHSDKCEEPIGIEPHKQIKAQVGTTRKQDCGQSAKIVNVVDDNNLTVQFEDGSYVFNVSYEDFRNKTVKSNNTESEVFLKTYKQDDGEVYRITSRDGSNCSIINIEDKKVYNNISIYMLLAGHVVPKITVGQSFTNSLGMKYTISTEDDTEYSVIFEDKSIGYALIDDFEPEKVYPEYMDVVDGKVEMYGYTDITVDSFEASVNKYVMYGTCKECGVTTAGVTDVFRRHQRSKHRR